MRTIVGEFCQGEYKVLKLDGTIPLKRHTRYLIDGKFYDIVPIYDAPNCIAIISDESLTGKTVKFVE